MAQNNDNNNKKKNDNNNDYDNDSNDKNGDLYSALTANDTMRFTIVAYRIKPLIKRNSRIHRQNT